VALASYHPYGAQNFEVAPVLLQNVCIPAVGDNKGG